MFPFVSRNSSATEGDLSDFGVCQPAGQPVCASVCMSVCGAQKSSERLADGGLLTRTHALFFFVCVIEGIELSLLLRQWLNGSCSASVAPNGRRTREGTHLCENETVMPLLAILFRSIHFLRWGCWRVSVVRLVVQAICGREWGRTGRQKIQRPSSIAEVLRYGPTRWLPMLQ